MKTYEEMARDVLARIEEYENERKKHKKAVIRLTAAAVPLCAAAVAGVVLWKGGALSPEPGQLMNNTPGGDIVTETVTAAEETSSPAAATKAVTASAQTVTEATAQETSSPAEEKTEAVTEAAEQQETSGAAAQTAPQTEAAATVPVTVQPAQTAATAASNTASAETQAAAPGGGGNDVMLRPGDTPSEFRTLISSYPYGVAGDMRAPYNGEVCLMPSVQYAMEEYGDSTDYLVMLEIWADNGSRYVNGYSELRAEAERLYSCGCIAAGVNTDSSGENWITLHVTYSQLKNISGRDDYGYGIMFPNSGSADYIVPPVINNGIAQ